MSVCVVCETDAVTALNDEGVCRECSPRVAGFHLPQGVINEQFVSLTLDDVLRTLRVLTHCYMTEKRSDVVLLLNTAQHDVECITEEVRQERLFMGMDETLGL